MNASLLNPSAALAALLCACSSTYLASETPGLVDVVNARVRDRKATVLLDSIDYYRDQPTYVALNLRIGRDSVSWIDAETLQPVTVPRSRLAEVSFTDHGKGASYGLLTGIGIGIGVGLAAAADGGDKFFGGDAGSLGAVVGIGVGLPAALIGAIIGGASGVEDRYEMLPPPHDSTSSSGHEADTLR
jgi:hypothetical protein